MCSLSRRDKKDSLGGGSSFIGTKPNSFREARKLDQSEFVAALLIERAQRGLAFQMASRGPCWAALVEGCKGNHKVDPALLRSCMKIGAAGDIVSYCGPSRDRRLRILAARINVLARDQDPSCIAYFHGDPPPLCRVAMDVLKHHVTVTTARAEIEGERLWAYIIHCAAAGDPAILTPVIEGRNPLRRVDRRTEVGFALQS